MLYKKLERLIKSRVSDLVLSDQSESSSSMDDHISFTLLLSQQLPIVEQELSSFVTKLMITDKDQQRYYFSSSDYTEKQQNLVGLDDQIKTLKEWIWHPISNVLVTSVVGMTGIGKTTLVKQVYSDPLVIDEFEIRLFVQIGPHYNQWEEIQLLVLNQLGVVPSDDQVLVNHLLWEALSSQKYLIVLDDVWADVWHELQYGGFPHNGKGSRVIVMSQIQSYYIRPKVILLPLLKDDQSWKLLRETALTPEEQCSRELEKIGKKIARNCEGLPAAIIQVGEDLRGKSFHEWQALSEKEDPLIIKRDDDIPLSKALYFSYMMLPQYLKLCFLYMGVFPKYYGIFRSKLIKLWVSEGLLYPYPRLTSIEEIAGQYLDLLIYRSIVLREKQASIDIEKTKKCRLHFTFRSLCVNEAKSEKFFHILKKYTDCKPEKMRSHQRLCVHNNIVLGFRQVHEWMESVLDVRSLLCFGPKQQYPVVLPMCFRLLKIIDALAIRFYEFPLQILALVHLTYLAITCDGDVPNSISKLWNLQVLIFCRHHNIKLSNGPIYLPIEVWKMKKLKQLYCMGFDLPAPPEEDSHLILENLLTVSGVSVHSCTMEVLSRMPNLMRIAIQIEPAHDSIETFSFSSHFVSLYQYFESIKYVVVNPNLMSQVVPCVPNFPVDILKISLSGSGFPWKNLRAIAALPNLTVLKLRWYACCGPEWKTSDGQFPRLEVLLLEDLDIEHWQSDGKPFPWLRQVIVRHCYKLKTMPDRFESVELLELDDCNLSFVKKMRKWRSPSGDEAKIRSSDTDL
ncbi:PREDICTED: putative late blight resistance protein homolog R1A-10 [Erythranthe guttata]|uniref:putative late blight resistance protein homolog R1A-10 n=1 Tax=Erythranthe guttata TaxID=4155 RepID=UPI00064E0205|nr:PREDICTED: putative late blight resistance protein homolog R1A-10 [Erythranthe guttata]|eukprot:XP_012827293.1 PREDICTED: putative late blight resistance protein homolog R1A-10 [Erythranthe guttata]